MSPSYGVLFYFQDADQFVVYSTRTQIATINEDQNDHSLPFSPLTSVETVVSLTYEVGSKKIFYTEVNGLSLNMFG